MKHTLIILLVVIFITACLSSAPAPTSTPVATAVPSTPTTEPTEIPAPIFETVVASGSDAEKAGIRVGTIAKENPDGSYTYTFTNTNNGRTIEDVGTAKIVDGRIEYAKAEFLNKQISTCEDMQAKMKANKANKKDLLDGVEIWDISQVEGDGVNIPAVIKNALVNDETLFPEGVLTGQKLDTQDYETPDGSIQLRYMTWDKEVQHIMDANPDKRPYIQLGCVPVVTSTEIPTVDKNGKTTIKQVVETSIAVITKWLNPPDVENPKGSQLVVVTYIPVNTFLESPPSDFVFTSRTTGIAKDAPYIFRAKIVSNPEKFSTLEQWNDTGIVPKDIEVKGGFGGIGAERNFH